MPAPRSNFRFALRRLYDWLDENVGGEVSAAWDSITGKPAVIASGANQAAARAAIGAGTSSLALGTTASTAMAGNDERVTTAIKGVAIAGNVLTFTRVDDTTFTVTLPESGA